MRGKVRVAGTTRSKFMRDDLPGGRVKTFFVQHSEVVTVEPHQPAPPTVCAAARSNDTDGVSAALEQLRVRFPSGLAHGEDVNDTDRSTGGGWTALHWASFRSS